MPDQRNPLSYAGWTSTDPDNPLSLAETMNRVALGPIYIPRAQGDIATVGAGAGPSQYSLVAIHPRTLRELTTEPDYSQAGSHTFSIKDTNGQPVGTVDTRWNPETGNLHIEDFQSDAGANSLGSSAVRQIRGLLLDRYPNVQTLSGQRITGAVSADRLSGAGPGRAALQTIGPTSND